MSDAVEVARECVSDGVAPPRLLESLSMEPSDQRYDEKSCCTATVSYVVGRTGERKG